jgi:EmrB/QacA subfamily drug resistance transporter
VPASPSTAFAPPSPTPPSLLRAGMPPWAAVAMACACSFMVVMDGAIVNVALPAMQADLRLSAAELQWVVDAYLLALGGFMLLAARASDLYGRRTVLQAGLALFTLASLAGGLAGHGALLLAARALQGLGASALATSTLAVIVAVHPQGPAKARAISLWAASSAVASAFGVVAGGALTSWAGWRWVMFVNVPIGAALFIAVGACLRPAHATGGARPKLDVPGAVAVTLGMGSLMYALSQSVALGWGAASVRASAAAAAVLLAAFWAVQRRSAHPLIRPDLLRARNVWLGNLVVMGLGASLTASTFFISLALQRVAGFSPLDTGLAMLPMGSALAIAAILSRVWMDRGVRRLPALGGWTGAAGLAWMAQLPARPDFGADLLGPTLLTGLGLGLMLMTAAHTAIDGLPPKDAGLASGLFNTSRQLGAALGIALLCALAHAVSQDALQAQVPATLAQLQGYHAAFLATAAISACAAWASLGLRQRGAA